MMAGVMKKNRIKIDFGKIDERAKMVGKVEIQSAISIFLVLLVVAIFALAHPAGRPRAYVQEYHFSSRF